MTELGRLRRPATPQTRTALEQLVGRYAKHYQIPQARIRNWISFMVLAGALERVLSTRDVDAAADALREYIREIGAAPLPSP